jgi:HSP20 family molecular chaperone IbpA
MSTNVTPTTNAEKQPPARVITPRVEVAENDSAIWILADMPGVAGDGAQVEFQDGVLSLEGRAADHSRLYRRRFTLADPQSVDLDKVGAHVANGVLRVDLPKAEKQRPRRIAITSS